MADKKIIWEEQMGNLILRNIEGEEFQVTVTNLDGKTEDRGAATVHYIVLSNIDHSFETVWREDTQIYQIIELCMAQKSEETKTALEMIVLTTFIVGSTADICQQFTTHDGETVVDGLRFSVEKAIQSYIERVKSYEIKSEDEPDEKIIADMKSQYEAQKAFDEMRNDA